jgi:hypothetical protein
MRNNRKKSVFGTAYKNVASAIALGVSLAPLVAPIAKADDWATTFPSNLIGLVNTKYTFDLNSVLGASGPFTVTITAPTVVQAEVSGSILNVKMLSPGFSTVIISNGTASKTISFYVPALPIGTGTFNVSTLAPIMRTVSDADTAKTLLSIIEPKTIPVNHFPASVVGVTYSVYYPTGTSKIVNLALGDLIKDPDNDSLTYSLVAGSAMGGVTAAVYGTTLTLSGTRTGDAVFTVQAADGKGGLGYLPIILIPPLDAPSVAEGIKNGYYTVDSGAVVPEFGLYQNFHPDGLQFTVSPSAANGLTPHINGSRLTFDGTPTADTSFVVSATDYQNRTAQATYRVLLNHDPSATVADNVYHSFYLPGQSIPSTTIDLAEAGKYFTDPDGDPLTYSVSYISTPSTGSLTASVSGSLLTYQADLYGQPASFIVTAEDQKGGSSSMSFTFAQDEAPAAVEPTVTKYILKNNTTGTLASVALSDNFTDADDDPNSLHYTIEESNSDYTGYSPSIANGVLTLSATGSVPEADTAKVVVKADDGKGYSTEATYMFEDFAQAEQIDVSNGFNNGEITMDILTDLLHADTTGTWSSWTYTPSISASQFVSLTSGTMLHIVPSSDSMTATASVTATEGAVTEIKTITFNRTSLTTEIADPKYISPGTTLTLEQLYKRYGLSSSTRFFAKPTDGLSVVTVSTGQMYRDLILDGNAMSAFASGSTQIGVVGLDPASHQGLVDTFSLGYGFSYSDTQYIVNNPYAFDSVDQVHTDGDGYFTRVDSDTTGITAQVMASGSILDFSFTPAALPYYSTFTVYSYYGDGTEASRYQVEILKPPVV